MKTATYNCLTPNCKATYSLNIEGGKEQPCYCYEEKDWRKFKLVRGTTKDSVHRISVIRHHSTFTVDEKASECDMRSNLGRFFTNAPKRSRETITVYRGALIVRDTIHHDHDRWQTSERLTALWLYGKWGRQPRYDVCHVILPYQALSIPATKRLVDRILKDNTLDD